MTSREWMAAAFVAVACFGDPSGLAAHDRALVPQYGVAIYRPTIAVYAWGGHCGVRYAVVAPHGLPYYGPGIYGNFSPLATGAFRGVPYVPIEQSEAEAEIGAYRAASPPGPTPAPPLALDNPPPSATGPALEPDSNAMAKPRPVPPPPPATKLPEPVRRLVLKYPPRPQPLSLEQVAAPPPADSPVFAEPKTGEYRGPMEF